MQRVLLVVGIGLAWLVPSATFAEATSVRVVRPAEFEVVQRVGYVPQFAHEHQLGGPALGFADVAIQVEFPADSPIPADDTVVAEYRLVLEADCVGRGCDWRSLRWLPKEGPREGRVRVDAGGWYRLELRWRQGEQVVASGLVERFGVGEVFLVAGQSYAEHANDESLRVQDIHERVVLLDWRTGQWRVAHDPPATPVGQGPGGTIWPAFGDSLLPFVQVPIGIANVAVGGTASSQWLPGGTLLPPLLKTGRDLGAFRAVLWQQGESDVIAKVSTEEYVKNLRAIHAAAATEWGRVVPWYLAKSTLHPTVYRDPAGEARIRRGLEQLSHTPGFRPGPDTDLLGGANRGGPTTRRHFTGLGQRNAAAMWTAAIWRDLSESRPDHELVLRDLPELYLLPSLWRSPIVHRESSLLLRTTPDGPIQARLAFPAAEVLEVVAADGSSRWRVGDQVRLEADHVTLTFLDPQNLPIVQTSELFVPRDAPNSYRHREGHPEQNLLYAPGKWFHERNVEITYRRGDDPHALTDLPTREVLAARRARLPRIRAKLAESQPVVLGVSGDSISTGLDASGLSFASPNQPGYVDLVAAQLQARFGSQFAVRNRAVSGWSIRHGLEDLDRLLAHHPDLLIVAYGMNDVGRRDPKWFGEQVGELLDRVRQTQPDLEVILVSPMLGNAEWVHTPRAMFAAYRDQLLALEGPGVAVADVTAVWQALARHKHDLDLSGNGLNHPNDCGHRLYAQAILELLVDLE